MLNTISWQSYWMALAISSGIYYLVIYLLYFTNELKIVSDPGSIREFNSSGSSDSGLAQSSPKQPTLSGEEMVSEFTMPAENTIEHLVYGCMDEINAFFEQAKRTKWQKDDLLSSLKNLLNKYPSLKTSEYKDSVSNVLITECQHNCSIHLNDEDVVQVWLGSSGSGATPRPLL